MVFIFMAYFKRKKNKKYVAKEYIFFLFKNINKLFLKFIFIKINLKKIFIIFFLKKTKKEHILF